MKGGKFFSLSETENRNDNENAIVGHNIFLSERESSELPANGTEVCDERQNVAIYHV